MHHAVHIDDSTGALAWPEDLQPDAAPHTSSPLCMSDDPCIIYCVWGIGPPHTWMVRVPASLCAVSCSAASLIPSAPARPSHRLLCSRLARAMDIMFTLHAEHEMNCSTAAARHLASSGVDVYTAIAGVAMPCTVSSVRLT